MIVIGAGGLAKQLIDDLESAFQADKIVFYDGINDHMTDFLGRYAVINSIEEVKLQLKKYDGTYLLAIGNPTIKQKVDKEFMEYGGKITSVISKRAQISNHVGIIEEGVNILAGTVIECGVHIKRGTNVNVNCSITHDSQIGTYCEIGPGVQICGEAKIGNNCSIGAGAIILPKIQIADNCTIGAGAVINKNVEANSVMVGNPAKRIQ